MSTKSSCIQMVWLVLVAGGHASGKKSVCEKLRHEIGEIQGELNLGIHLLDMKAYQVLAYKPDVDFDGLIQHIDQLDKEDAESIVLVYGNYALFNQELREMANVKVFVDTDADSRLAQWILRDVAHGNLELAVVLKEYLDKARPEYIRYIQRTSDFADVLLPKGANSLGVPLIASSLLDQIKSQSLSSSSKSFSKSLDSFDLRKEVFEEDLQYYAAI